MVFLDVQDDVKQLFQQADVKDAGNNLKGLRVFQLSNFLHNHSLPKLVYLKFILDL